MSLKAEKVEPEYQEGEPVTLKEEPTFLEEPLSLKEEPLFLEEHLKEEPFFKEEPNCDLSAWADLYTDHEIKNDVVVGPIILQPQDAAFATPVLEKSCEQLAPIKSATRKAHRCYICQRTFFDDSMLINHVCVPQDVLDGSTLPHTVSERSCKTDQANNCRDKPNFNHNYSAGEPIYCDICQKQFKHKSSLKVHRLTHNKTFSCKICSMKFKYQNDLDAHHKYHMGFDNNYNIDDDTVLNGVGHYVCTQMRTFTHIKDTAPQGSSDVAASLQLPKCRPPRQILIQDSSKLKSASNEHFAQKYDHIEHQQLHAGLSKEISKKTLLHRNQGIQGNQPSPKQNPISVVVNLNVPLLKYLYCEICRKEIKVKHNLNAHMKSHHKKEQNVPQRRNQDIKDDPRAKGNPNDIVVNSNKHKLKHKKEKYLYCEVYKKKIKVKAERLLLNHKRMHIGEEKFICDICQKAFKHKNKLVTHIKYHLRTKLSKKRFSCDICKKQLVNNSCLSAHKLTHAPEKQYSCRICEKGYHTKGVLMKHIRYVHERKKPFKCETCQKAFPYSSNLRIHELLHGEKKLICKICGKKFHRKAGLLSHMAIHTVRDPFICDVCKRHFNRKSGLISHIKIIHAVAFEKCTFLF